MKYRITSFSSIKSRSLNDTISSILVLLASPYLSFCSISSSFISSYIRASDPNTSFNQFIFVSSSARSVSILSRSKALNRESRISNISFACSSLSSNRAIRADLAVFVSLAAFISLITSSIFDIAIIKPFNMCSLFSARSNSYCSLLIVTSFRCFM